MQESNNQNAPYSAGSIEQPANMDPGAPGGTQAMPTRPMAVPAAAVQATPGQKAPTQTPPVQTTPPQTVPMQTTPAQTWQPSAGQHARTSQQGYWQEPPHNNARQQYATQQNAYNAPSATAVKETKRGGGGKSFVLGFIGGLVACALAIGGFYLITGGLPGRVATETMGTTNQTVINAVDEGMTLPEAVAAKALPSVVAIYNYQDAGQQYGYGYGRGNQGGDSLQAAGMGSGVVISDDGYIITNYHVIEDAAALTVIVDGKERTAEYVGGDKSSDVAVIKVEDSEGLVAADIGDSDNLVIGQWVMTVGAPLGLEQSVATGVVSATNRDTTMTASSSSDPYAQYFGYAQGPTEYVYYPNMIQTDAVINPGNSGGALVDADGKLIGINSMLSTYSGDYAGVGFAIPINYAIGIAKDVIAGKEPTHAVLGVSLSQVNRQVAQQYNLSAEKGAYISYINEGGGAADSDLQVGDIITAVDGKVVSSSTDVTLEVRSHKVGDTVTVTVNRNGETIDVPVTLTSDENIVTSSGETTQNDQGQNQEQNQGQGQGQGNGITEDELEYLMRMLRDM